MPRHAKGTEHNGTLASDLVPLIGLPQIPSAPIPMAQTGGTAFPDRVLATALAPRQVVFIEADVPDAQDLIRGVRPGVEVVVLDPSQDGVQQIAAWLTSHAITNLTGIDIVAHGADGEIALGTGMLSSATLGAYQTELQQIGTALAPGGAIQLYGCDVGEDAAGVSFLDQLSQATGGANIAAASHLVGDAAGGGSFDLNVNIGTIDAAVPFTSDALASFKGELSLSPAVPQLDVVWSADSSNSTTTTRLEQVGISGTTFVAGSSIDLADASTLDLNQLRGATFDAPLDRYFLSEAVDQTANLFSAMVFEGSIGSPSAAGTINISASSSIFYTGLAFDPLADKVYLAEQVYSGLTNGSTTSMTSTIDGIGIYSFTPSANIAAAVTPTLVIDGHSTITGGGTLQGPGHIAVVPGTNLLFFGDTQEDFLANNSAHIDVGNVLSHQWSTLAIPGSVISTAIEGAPFLSVAVDATSNTGGILFFTVENPNVGSVALNGIFSVDYTVTGIGTTQSASIVGTVTTLATGAAAELPADIVLNPVVVNGTATGAGTFYIGSGNGTVYAGNMASAGTLTAVGDLSGGSSAVESLTFESLPTIAPSAGISYAQGTTVTLSSGLTLANTDNQDLVSATVTVAPGDTLHYTTVNGIAGSFSSGTLTLSGTNTAANYQAALDSITFSSTAAAGTQTVNWSASDGVVIGTATSNVTIAAAISLGTGGTVTYHAGGAAVVLDATTTVSDTNNLIGGSVWINSGSIAGDALNFSSQNGITGSYNSSTGTLTLTGTASAANYQAALDSITYDFTPSDGDPTQAGNDPARTIDWQIRDAGGTSSVTTSTLDVAQAQTLGYGQTIDETGIIAATETVAAGVMTLQNGGGTTVGTIAVGTSLNTSDFTLKSDGSGGTDVIVSTVFGTYSSGVTLLTNPTTIAATARATNSAASGNAVSGPTGTAWTVTNLGTVAESGATTPIGISLAAGGTVINSGSIGAATTASNGVGVSLAAGGVVTNQSGGAISGPFGVQASAAPATVVNAGTITGNATAVARAGVKLSAGGSVTNQSGGTISGFYGLWGQTTAISVVNQGVLIGNLGTSLGVGAYLAAGGTLTNAATASITGGSGVYVRGAAGVVQNAGVITGNATNASNAGVYLRVPGSSLTNQSGGTITGFRGAVAINSTVVNAGSLGGNATAASGAGVLLTTGGVLTNQSGGTVTGFMGVYNSSGAATVVNAGDIAGNASTGKGISLKGAGTVTNQSGGTISGGADAVQFAAGVTNLLVVDPGAVFTGTVNGGNTIGATSISTLELASGAGSGTISGIGSSYVGFAAITVDSGARWTIAGYNTLAAGVTLTNSGTDTVIGTLVNAGRMTAASTLVGVSVGTGGFVSNQSGGTIAAYYAAVIGNTTGTLVNSGRISAASTGAGTGVKLANGGSFTNSLGGTVTGDIGVYATGASAATIVNAGSINGQGGGNNGVALLGGGTFSNLNGGTVTNGAFFLGVAGTLINAGFITGTHAAVSLTAGGTVINQSGGTLSGSLAAVQFTAGRTARVVDAPGAVFIGKVEGGNTIGATSISTLELASGASTGTLVGLGAQFTHFAQVTIDAGASWAVGGTLTGFATLTDAGNVKYGITLGATSLTVSNQSTGTIDGGSGIGVYARTNATAARVVNAGLITATTAAGVQLAGGGSVTNLSGGTITGYSGIIGTNTALTVVNTGSIGGNATVSGAAGVTLAAGGAISNQSGGTISGYYNGVEVSGAPGTVVNAGVINGSRTNGSGYGVKLSDGGSVTNLSTGTITAYNGVWIQGAPGTVLNLGLINSADVADNDGLSGVDLQDGGLVTNGAAGGTASTATILGYAFHTGAVQFGASGTGTLVNFGTVRATTGNTGVVATNGTVINGASGATGALIVGGEQGNGVKISGAGTVINYATISAVTPTNANQPVGFGVSVGGGGVIRNLGSRALIQAYLPVYAAGSATVINSGTVQSQYGTGPGAYAVVFGGGTNRLIVDPGATFIGTVLGSSPAPITLASGNPAASVVVATAAGTATLELASGATTGTLSGLGTQFVGFVQTTIDAGANWILSGANTVVAGTPLTNSGTLTDTGTLINAGTMTGNPIRLNGGTLTNQANGLITASYVFGVASGGTDSVVNQGTITNSAGSAIYLAAAGNVSNAAGGRLSGGGIAVKLKGSNATLSNLGQIDSTGASPSSYGVYLRNGGLVTNGQAGAGTSTATIQGYYGAAFKSVDSLGKYGTLHNYGTVLGGAAGGSAVLMSNGGTVLNGQSGATAALIEGHRYGVSSNLGSVVNDATIIATGTQSGDYGVAIQGAGSVSNLGTAALIEGYVGVEIGLNGTVTNAGTIESNQGTTGTAIRFTGGNARLIEDPGAPIVGGIYGGSGGTAVLELASGSSAGTITGFGTSITNFTSLVFDTGGRWTIGGNDSANGLGTLGISGFTVGDTIDLNNFTAVNRTFAANALVLGDGIGDYETLHIQGSFSTANFRISADGSGGTDVTFQTPPAVTAGGTVTFTGGGSAVTLDSGLTVADPGSATLVSGTVSFGSGFRTGDTLNFVNQNGITGSFNTATGTLLLSGSASVADYQTALDQVTYSFAPGDGDPTGGGGDTSRTIDWTVNDGTAASTVSTSTLDVTHVAPMVTASGTVTFVAGGTAVTLDPALSLSDVDSGGLLNGGTVSITGFVAGDVLSANTTGLPAITASYNASTGVLTLSGSDTLADYKAVLDSIAYSSTVSDPTSGGTKPTRTISWSVNDGVASSGSATTTVDVTLPPPVIGGTTAGQTTTDEASISPFTTVSISDSDFGQTETVTVTLSNKADGTLSNVGTGSYNSSTGVYTVTGTDLAVSTAVDGLLFTPTAHQVAPGATVTTSFTIKATDTNGSTSSNSTTTVIATAVNDPPVITGTVAGQRTTDAAAISPFSGVSISDIDFGQSETVTVTLSDKADGTLSNVGSGSYDSATGVYTVTGSDAAVTSAVDGLLFTPTAHQTAPGSAITTTFTIQTTDTAGGTSSNSATTVVATAVNDPPVIAGTASGQTTSDAAAIAPFAGVSISDADFGQTETVTITLSNKANGTLSNLGAGLYDSSTGVYSITGTDSAVTAALQGLVFTPTDHEVVPGATVTTGFTIAVTDTAGGSTSNSATSVIATAAEDAPAIAHTVSGQGVSDAATVDPFSTVTITDPDFGATETVTITLTANSVASDANGVLSGTGLSKTGVGTYTLTTGTPASVTALLNALVFTPTQHEVTPGATVTTGMTLSVSDGIDGTPTTDSGTSVVATAIATPPSITGALANQGVPNETPSTPFSTVALIDPNVGSTDTVTVTMSAAGNGTFSNLGAGSYDAATGVYSVSGTASAVTAALDALVFTPIAQSNVDVATTQFTINPGSGGTPDSTTSVTSVQQILGLASVPTSQIAISVSPDGTGFAPAQNGKTNEAVVTDPAENATYSVPTGYQALFAGGQADVTLSDTAVGNAILVANQGNDELIAGAPNDILVAGSGNDSLVGGNYTSTVMGGVGATTVFAGAGAMHVVEGSGPMFFSGNSNGGSTISGGSGPLTANLTGEHQTVQVGSGAATITAAGSANDVIGGTSALSATITGTADTVQAGTGSNALVSSGSGDLIIGSTVSGAGPLSVTESGTNDTIQGGTNPTTVTASSAALVYGGSGSLDFVGGTGIATVFGGAGADLVTAGTGGVIFNLGAADNATVNSGTGAVTVFGAPNTSVNLIGSSGLPDYVVAGAGNETLNASGSSSSNWLSVSTTVSSAASVVMVGGAGNDTLIAGSAPGSEVMTGGGGDNAFVFFKQVAGGASDIITDFNADDAVYIEGYAPGSAGALQAASRQTSGGLMLTLSDGTTITFSNLTDKSALDGKIQYG
jgi:hypothetical protein